MNEFYLVNGKLFEVASNRKQEFLLKYPDAILQDNQEQVKLQGADQGVTALLSKAPNMDLNLVDGSSVSQNSRISFGESIKNSFKNFAEQIGDIGEFYTGESAAMDLASSALAQTILGRQTVLNLEKKYGKDSWLLEGMTEQDLLEAIPAFRIEQQQKLPTKKVIQSIKEGDFPGVVAASIDAVINAIGSIAYGVTTFGSGFFFDFMAENYLNYNEELAKQKSMSLSDLIKSGDAETKTPAIIGFSQSLLENIGIGKILKGGSGMLASKNAGKLTKKILDIAEVGTVEALTEWKQYGLTEANKLIAEGKSSGEVVKETLIKMLTEQDAYENLLQGFIGGGGARASKNLISAGPAVRSTKESNEIQRNFNALVYNSRVLNESEDNSVRQKAQDNIDTAKANIEILVGRSNAKINNLSEENQKRISDINKETQSQVIKLQELDQKLQNKEITKDEYNVYLKAAKDQFNSNVLRIKGILSEDQGVEMIIDKSTSFGAKMGEALGIKSQDIETNREFADILGKTEQEVKNIGGVYVNGQIYFNKQAAKDTFQINIGAHEVLHPIINSQIGNKKQQGKMVEGVKKRLTSRQVSEMDAIMESRGYGIESGKYNTEYFNVFTDALAKQELSLDKTVLEKLYDFIKSFFKQYDLEIGFANSDQVFNFLTEYSKSAQNNEVSQKVLDAIDKTKLAKELKKKRKQFSEVRDEFELEDGSFDYEQANKVIDDLVGEKDGSGAYVVSKKEWDEGGISKAYNAIIQGNKLDHLIKRGIIGKNVHGKPIETFVEDVKLEMTGVLMRFNPEQNDSLMGWINANLNFNKGKITKEYKKTAANRLDIEAGEVGFVANEARTEEDFSEFDTKRGVEEIDPDSIIPSKLLNVQKETKKAVVDNIDNMNVSQLTYSKVPLLEEVVNSFAQKIGIKPNKITNFKDNLGKGEAIKIQEFIYPIVDSFIKLLPKYTSVVQDADLGVQGKSVRIPTKIINDKKFGLDLYVAYRLGTGRVEDAQGNPQYVLPDNAFEVNEQGETVVSESFRNKYLRVAGMNPDGSPISVDARGKLFDGQSPEAQRLKGILNFAIRAAINTEVRIRMQELGINPNAINNISAGKSQYQFSQEGDFDFVLPELQKMIFEKSELKRFTKTMFENEELLDAANKIYDITLNREDYKAFMSYKYKNNSQQWDYDNIVKTQQYQEKFLNSLPDVFKDNKGLAKAITGFQGINSLYQVTHDLYISDNKVLVDKNGKILRDRKSIESITLSEQQVDNFISKNKLKAEGNLDQNQVNFINRLNDWIKGEGNITTLNDIRKVLNNDKISYDKKLAAIVKHKDAKIREQNNALFNLINLYKMAFIKAGDTKQERKNRLLFVIKTTDFDTSSIGGINSLASLDLTILKQEKTRYSLESYKTNSNLGKQLIFDILSGKETVLNSDAYKAGFVPTNMLQQAPNISQQESIDNVKKNTNPDEQFSKVKDDFDIEKTSLEEKMAEILSLKDTRYEKGDIIDTATSSRLAVTRKKIRNIIPPSANDFLGLLYSMLGKGSLGERQLDFFDKKLVRPFGKAIMQLNTSRQAKSAKYKQFLKDNKGFQKTLNEDSGVLGYNKDQALRVYLYTKSGYKIPGIENEQTVSKLQGVILGDPTLLKYASQLSSIMQHPQGDTWINPDDKSWLAGSVQQDFLRSIDETSRKLYLKEWIENKEQIFSKNNMNKIRATFGNDYLSALKDILNRMETGRSRPVGTNKTINNFLNWIRGSVAVTMFFNTRSALLQTISTFNYINFSDNNIFKASAAFADTKQWAKDFLYLYNSDYLKERRGGLRTDVQEAEIAEAIRGKTGFQSLLGTMLQKGFAFTRAGDAFAISAGGATFFRNRVNSYIKKGKDPKVAEELAFSDFQEITEETQQSARADRLSKQQTDVVGRIFLAFQNTPMQYTRKTVKAIQDFRAGRGSKKKNLSIIMYYVVLQNVMFNALQNALFSQLFPKDDDKNEEEEKREQKQLETVGNRMIDTFLRGIGIYGAILATGKNVALKFIREDQKMRSGEGGFDETGLLIEVLNISPAIGIKSTQFIRAARGHEYNWKYYKEMGLSVENPALDVLTASGSFANIPADRLLNKVRNIKDALDSETEIWQKIALLGGWDRWDIAFEPDDSVVALKKKKSKGKPKRPTYNLNKGYKSPYNKRKYNN